MKKMQFSIVIHASKERVWETLLNDKSFREWASIIDPGTYMVGDVQVGNEIQFISESSGYGVTSLVEKLIAGELLLLRHRVDTKDSGKRERKKEWTGGEERYSLTERDGTTTLTISLMFQQNWKKNYALVIPMRWIELKYWLKEGSSKEGDVSLIRCYNRLYHCSTAYLKL